MRFHTETRPHIPRTEDYGVAMLSLVDDTAECRGKRDCLCDWDNSIDVPDLGHDGDLSAATNAAYRWRPGYPTARFTPAQETP